MWKRSVPWQGPCLTWVRAGLFQRSVISLRFSGRSSSCSACAASSMFLQKGSSHTGLALPGERSSPQRVQRPPENLAASRAPSTDAEVVLPPPALCRHVFSCPGSRHPPVISADPSLAGIGRGGATAASTRSFVKPAEHEPPAGPGQRFHPLKALRASTSRASIMPCKDAPLHPSAAYRGGMSPPPTHPGCQTPASLSREQPVSLRRATLR